MDPIFAGFGLVFRPDTIAAIAIGALAGFLVGVLPGLNASGGVALLLPFTYGLSPVTGLALLTALYTSAEYGGSVTAIAVNMPGEPGALATTFDGYALTKQGKPGKALGVSMWASMFGGIISTVLLLTFSLPLANFALTFGPAEFFALGVFGLTLISSLSGRSAAKGFVVAALGLSLNVVGLDVMTGETRFTFGEPELFEGFQLVPVLIGLFALSELFVMMEELTAEKLSVARISSALPTVKEIISIVPASVRGSLIGVGIGAIPGAGKAIASLIAWNEERRVSKHPERFGKGCLEGVAAPEAANNAVVGGALIPTLALGVPGTATTAIMLGAMLIYGVTPGPKLFEKNPEIIYGIFISLVVSNLVILLMGLAGTRFWVRVISMPAPVMIPIILAISFVGAYNIGNSMFNVWVMFGAGVIGYGLRRYGFPVAPIVLALILGGLVESNLRRGLLINDGNVIGFLSRPLAIAFLIAAVLAVVGPALVGSVRRARERAAVHEL